MTGRAHRAAWALVAAVVISAAVGCGASDDSGRGPTPTASSDPWADIDTSRPSEDPVGTVYGYVQAMAAGEPDRACEFQYRGSSDFDDDPCILADEQPARDARRAPEVWKRWAAYGLADYRPSEDDRGWVVSLPEEPEARWRIRQNDAGIWFIA